MRGTVAFAPGSHLGAVAPAFPALGTSESGLSPLIALQLRGLATTYPSLHPECLLSARARALYPEALTRCLPQLGQRNSFGGLAPKDVFGPRIDYAPAVKRLTQNDPEHLRIATPVRVEQGLADTTVPPNFSDDLVAQDRKRGNKVSYATYPRVDHRGIVTAAAPDATAYIATRFR